MPTRPSHARPRASALAAAGATVLLALLAALLLAPQRWELRVVGALALALAAPLGLALVLCITRLRGARDALHELSEAAARSTLRDPLTGLLNEAALHEDLVRAAAHARRRVEPVSVLMIDVCRLGEVNERFGPEAGDEILRALGECMRATLRAEDAHGRLGADRFLVVLAGTIGVQAELVAERLRAVAARVEFPGLDLPRGIELNIASATAVRATPEGLLDAAGRELHRLKSLRRERHERPRLQPAEPQARGAVATP